jgi:hypothetical protein
MDAQYVDGAAVGSSPGLTVPADATQSTVVPRGRSGLCCRIVDATPDERAR